MFRFIIVRLSQKNSHTKTFDLRFKLESNQFVHKWTERYLAAQQRQDPISEPWAFYNLNQDWSEQTIVDFINQHIDVCNSLVPDMFDRKLTSVKDQDTLNYIHSVFERHHGQIDDWLTNVLFEKHGTRLRESLSHINQTVHRAESHNKDQYIRVVYFDLPKDYSFTAEDYALFTDTVDFGGLYTLYADVGKNLESLSQDNDNHHHDFVPNLHYSVDFKIRFTEIDQAAAEIKKQRYKKYYDEHQDYFEQKGYIWGDPKLTTGAIKLAQLIYVDKQDLLEQISKYNNIQSVFLI